VAHIGPLITVHVVIGKKKTNWLNFEKYVLVTDIA